MKTLAISGARSSFGTCFVVALTAILSLMSLNVSASVQKTKMHHTYHYITGKGSFYRKVASGFGDYTGVTGIVTLPAPKIDQTRFTHSGSPLDGFSIYMGGNAKGHEVDAGLSWEKNPEKGGTGMVWRPFVRAPRWLTADTKLFWKPGDKVRMTVEIVKNGWLRLSITDASGLNLLSLHTYKRDFPARSFRLDNACQFKRVNSIDQVGREGRDTLPSSSTVSGAVWKNTYLLQGIGRKQVMLSINKLRHIEVDAGITNIHLTRNASDVASGGESVTISANSSRLTALRN